jgi:ATP-dependent RNA helicase MSS116
MQESKSSTTSTSSNATRVLLKLTFLSSCYYCASNAAACFSIKYQQCRKPQALSQRLYLASADDGNESPETRNKRIIRPRRPSSLVARETIQRKREEEEALEKLCQARLDPTLLSNTTFAERSDIHPSMKRAITQLLRLEQMTEIQAKTFRHIMQGSDVLGRARTGSGKTHAFLIPSIQRWMDLPSSTITPTTSITAAVAILILVPTRELCTQISEQAKLLLTYHSDNMIHNRKKRLTVCTMYGGTTLRSDMSYLNINHPNRYNNNNNNNNHLLLIATPGRLLDHLQNTKLQGGKKFSDIMTTLQIFILDESDRLLVDLRDEVRKVISYLPKNSRHNQQPRQTLMFSATLPPLPMKQVAAEIMSPNYITVDCCTYNTKITTMDGRMAEHVNRKDNSTIATQKSFHVTMETNVRVQQSYVIIPSTEIYISSVIQVIQSAVTTSTGEKKNTSYNKVIAFFPTAWITSFFAYIFQEILSNNIPIFELHSRKRQGFRSKTREAFNQARHGILFTSDVSARGVDYPDVTHVLQVRESTQS